MAKTSIQVFDRNRAVLSGIELPDPVPTRIYISDRAYDLISPRVTLPPLAQTAKLILNWAMSTTPRVAKNVLYALLSPPADPSNTAHLQTLANNFMAAWNTANVNQSISNSWQLNSVTAKDNSGSSGQATSVAAPITGGMTGPCTPPSVAVVLSWQIAASYRGGKPRTYLPGVPTGSIATTGDSALQPSYAITLWTNASSFLAAFNGLAVGGGAATLGTVSHFHGHTLRPVPDFFAYARVRVHERIDSQRRRTGKEVGFATEP